MKDPTDTLAHKNVEITYEHHDLLTGNNIIYSLLE